MTRLALSTLNHGLARGHRDVFLNVAAQLLAADAVEVHHFSAVVLGDLDHRPPLALLVRAHHFLLQLLVNASFATLLRQVRTQTLSLFCFGTSVAIHLVAHLLINNTILFVKKQLEEVIKKVENEVLKKVVVVRKEKKIAAAKIAKERAEYIYSVNDRVRIIGANSIGSIDKIDKKNITINFGNFTTKTSIEKLELVEKAKK